jgi:hypothetical protein|nr:MAG TPA: tail protein [Caudoviricetes sp.]
MAKNDAKNVSVGKPMVDGAIFIAPAGTALPTDAVTTLDKAYENVGYISEDGVTNAIETDSEEIKAWGGDIVANPQTSRSETFSYTMIEQNEVAFKHVFGSENVAVEEESGAITIKHNGKEREENPIVVETLLSGGKVKRQVIPRGKVKEIGEIAYKDDEPIGYETTIQALLDADGNTAYEYIAKLA